MSKTRLIALAGPLTILVGSVWLTAALATIVVWSGLASSEQFWDSFLAVWSVLFVLSFIMLFFALVGTRLRFHQAVGAMGKLGLAVSVAGCAAVIVAVPVNIVFGAVAPVVDQLSWTNYAALVGALSIRIGYILFGVDALRYRVLPRWNLLPLLVGLTVVLSLASDWFGVPAFLPTQYANPFLHFAITGSCWVLLGIAMMNQRREPQATAAI